MKRIRRKLFNLFAFSLLAFAIYLNFFYKEKPAGLLRSKPSAESAPKPATDLTAKPHPTIKK
ncbi:MAG: hypothetical protein H7122_14845 [Chitinophagaceae bacterium]|nr:hypothetical protein [Chitinophagaceae bacterium]